MGTTGMLTPAIRPSSFAQIPPAIPNPFPFVWENQEQVYLRQFD